MVGIKCPCNVKIRLYSAPIMLLLTQHATMSCGLSLVGRFGNLPARGSNYLRRRPRRPNRLRRKRYCRGRREHWQVNPTGGRGRCRCVGRQPLQRRLLLLHDGRGSGALGLIGNENVCGRLLACRTASGTAGGATRWAGRYGRARRQRHSMRERRSTAESRRCKMGCKPRSELFREMLLSSRWFCRQQPMSTQAWRRIVFLRRGWRLLVLRRRITRHHISLRQLLPGETLSLSGFPLRLRDERDLDLLHVTRQTVHVVRGFGDGRKVWGRARRRAGER